MGGRDLPASAVPPLPPASPKTSYRRGIRDLVLIVIVPAVCWTGFGFVLAVGVFVR